MFSNTLLRASIMAMVTLLLTSVANATIFGSFEVLSMIRNTVPSRARK
jgi:hypothetical protein